MSEPKRIAASADGSSGVDVTYVKRRRTLLLGGWYDGMFGIYTGDADIPLAEFLDRLGISDSDIRKARKERT